MRKKWDLETDVLVVGYGLAGGVAASVARDEGAEVLILEKGQYPGGISILSGGGVKCAASAEDAYQYFLEMSGGRLDKQLVRTFADGFAQNEGFLRELAGVSGAEIVRIPHREGVYPFPGRETIYMVHVPRVPGFDGFPWMRCFTRAAGVNLVKIAMDNVEVRGISVELSCPVTRLEADDGGAIVGAVADREGREVAVLARRAVILATGGFEQSEWLQKQYLQGMPFYSMAPLTHTGDGIAMAQKVGAALWHMWHIHGAYGFKFAQSPIAYRHIFRGHRNNRRKMPWIVVDKLGRRYMNEYPPAAQDTAHRPMEIFDPDIPGYPRIPSYIVFDDDGRQRGPIGDPLAFPGFEYEWSKDNSRELEAGWIVKADSVNDLARTIRERYPENRALMREQRLEETVRSWNAHVQSGEDPFCRPPLTMMPIRQPPFYAAEVWPIITNTQGGPVHNDRQQVVDSFGQVIPHLYAVGELGSFFGHLYELGSNLSECLISGKIAGRSAAAEVRWR